MPAMRRGEMGVFSRYAEFFYQRPSTIVEAMIFTIILARIYFLVGIVFLLLGTLENQLLETLFEGI